jgi:hypothetical protein
MANMTTRPTRPPLSTLLEQLRSVLEAQGEALGADDFTSLDRLTSERERLVQALGGYTSADVAPAERALLEQIGALDQRLIEQTRSGLEQTSHGLRDVHRGRAALHEYRRRGQNVIRNLSLLDREG